MKKNIFFIQNIFLLLIAVLFPSILFAAPDLGWFDSVALGVSDLFGKIVPVLLAFALFLFIWGLVVFIAQSGDEKVHEEGRKKMVWGIIILFVIVSVWGIVALLQQITGVDSSAGTISAPAIPTPN